MKQATLSYFMKGQKETIFGDMIDDSDTCDGDDNKDAMIHTLITTSKFNPQTTVVMPSYWFYTKIPCDCCCYVVCNYCRRICVTIEDLAKRTNVQIFRRFKSKKILHQL